MFRMYRKAVVIMRQAYVGNEVCVCVFLCQSKKKELVSKEKILYVGKKWRLQDKRASRCTFVCIHVHSCVLTSLCKGGYMISLPAEIWNPPFSPEMLKMIKCTTLVRLKLSNLLMQILNSFISPYHDWLAQHFITSYLWQICFLPC